MTASFMTVESWHAAIAAAVAAGLTFKAYDYGMAVSHAWSIEYTGGY